MNKGVYTDFTKKELILRDHLAIDRTMLATENTFLSYIRTSLTMLVLGVTLIHFSSILFVQILGVAIILGSFLLYSFGYKKVSKIKKSINAIRIKNARNKYTDSTLGYVVSPLNPHIFEDSVAENEA